MATLILPLLFAALVEIDERQRGQINHQGSDDQEIDRRAITPSVKEMNLEYHNFNYRR